MYIINIHQARTYLSRLLARLAGCKPQSKRQPDVLKGEIVLPEGFFDPLPENEQRAWDGKQGK